MQSIDWQWFGFDLGAVSYRRLEAGELRFLPPEIATVTLQTSLDGYDRDVRRSSVAYLGIPFFA